MGSSVRTTLIVWMIAIALIAAAIMTSGSDRGRDAHREAAARPLLSADQLPVDDVRRMTLQRRGEPALVFERHEGGWRQVEPFAHPMDPFSMRQLAAQATQIEVVDTLDDPEPDEELSLESLALDPPNAVLTYEWPGNSLSLRLGRKGIAGRAYLQIEDDRRVYIVGQALHNRAVEMDPREWRDRTLFPEVSIESDEIVREGGNVRFVMSRLQGRWQLTEPVETRLDRKAIEAYIQILGGARLSGFLVDQPEDLSRFGLAPPTAVIAVSSTKAIPRPGGGNEVDRVKQTQRLIVGSPIGAGTQDRFGLIDGRDTVVRIPASVLQGLFASPADLIDPTGSGVVAADVKALVIQRNNSSLRLERDLERWIAIEHGGVEVAASQVNELLAHLTELRASEIAIEPYPHEAEDAIVTLFGFDGRPMDTVRIARDPDSGKWALENGDNVMRIFPASFELRLDAGDYGLSAP